MSAEELARKLEDIAAVIGRHLDSVFDDLSGLSPHVKAIADRSNANGPRRQDFEQLHPLLHEIILRHSGLVDGAGIAFGEDVLVDTKSWLDWWRIDPNGGLRFAPHVFNPKSVRYYDYTSMSWFQLPSTRGAAVAVGPYIDSGGTDLNIVTLGVPVGASRGGPSVVAADLSLSALGSLFLTAVLPSQWEIVLVNDSGRVIASNTAKHVTGTLLFPHSAGPFDKRFKHAVPIPSSEPARVPWHIAILNSL